RGHRDRLRTRAQARGPLYGEHVAGYGSDVKPSMDVRGLIWLAYDDENFGGPGRIALLEAIGSDGSITRAARRVGLSYKAAWDAIYRMNNLAGEPLVSRVTGGKGGGSTRLTARGE